MEAPDVHHKILYGIVGSAIIVAGGAGGIGYRHLASQPPVVNAAHVTRVNPGLWPPLSDDVVATLTRALAPLIAGKPVIVYCTVNGQCADVAEDIEGALKGAGAITTADTPWDAADGLQVGAPKPEDAQALADALTIGMMTPKVGPPHGDERYISFGRKVSAK